MAASIFGLVLFVARGYAHDVANGGAKFDHLSGSTKSEFSYNKNASDTYSVKCESNRPGR